MAARYHRIRRIRFSSGFLEGAELEFSDGLNCIIGGRGTGKTTVLEVLRYVLDRMPDPAGGRDRSRRLERLITHNLEGGSVRVEIETVDGFGYTVERRAGEEPTVTNAGGEVMDIAIGRDVVFGAEIYSQNEIEEIATEPRSQLDLIDGFTRRELEPVEDEIRRVIKALTANTEDLLRLRREIADLSDEIQELPDLDEKLRALRKEEEDERTQELRRENDLKVLREHERRVISGLSEALDESGRSLEQAVAAMRRRVAARPIVDLSASPNRELVQEAEAAAEEAFGAVEGRIAEALRAVAKGQEALAAVRQDLTERQRQQDRRYRDYLEAHEADRSRAKERIQLEKRHAELHGRRQRLGVLQEQLDGRLRERDTLRSRLSELRDHRFELRRGVAEHLSGLLAPMIRIRIEPYGDASAYAHLLRGAFKGSGLRYAPLVEKLVAQVPPTELANLVQTGDREALERRLGVDPERATRLLILLKDSDAIAAVETVELRDRPVIELRDGEDYKASDVLSTGQKCTTILPILLLENERPLLVDQPEDNLDNAFVYETIVPGIQTVQERRQMIFVTHNPNIPVLGEARRVFVLESTGRRGRIKACGSVDDVRTDLEAVLEGGADAFKQRMARYGY